MATRVFDHKGRQVLVSVVKRDVGWTWSYCVGDGPVRRGQDRSVPDEDQALIEGIAAAKAEIDGT